MGIVERYSELAERLVAVNQSPRPTATEDPGRSVGERLGKTVTGLDRTIRPMAFTLFDTSVQDKRVGVLASDVPRPDPHEFHRRLAGYRATALVEDRQLAEDLGCETVWLKLELHRFGLPSFKSEAVRRRGGRR